MPDNTMLDNTMPDECQHSLRPSSYGGSYCTECNYADVLWWVDNCELAPQE